MDNVSLNDARAICHICGSPIKDRPKRCGICNRAVCFKHDHALALVRKEGTDVIYACLDCIKRDHLHVIDPNHPLYLNN